MEFPKPFLKYPWLIRFAFVAAGALLGYGYYHFIGCNSGTCPITSNPWRSSAYGALMGIIMSWGRNNPAVAPPSSERTED
jgi:hypothetical protein